MGSAIELTWIGAAGLVAWPKDVKDGVFHVEQTVEVDNSVKNLLFPGASVMVLRWISLRLQKTSKDF
jgi:hypothetical protein